MKINTFIEIPESEIQEAYIRGSGPGGQNINKVSSAVQLRYNVGESETLATEVKIRLRKLFSNRINSEGVLIIKASRYRTQTKNRKDARERLAEIIRASMRVPHRRIITKPSMKSRQTRVDNKKRRTKIKAYRRKIYPGGSDY